MAKLVECIHSMGEIVECIHSTVGTIECIHSTACGHGMYTLYTLFYRMCTFYISICGMYNSTTSSTTILSFSVQNIVTSGPRCRDLVK